MLPEEHFDKVDTLFRGGTIYADFAISLHKDGVTASILKDRFGAFGNMPYEIHVAEIPGIIDRLMRDFTKECKDSYPEYTIGK